MSGISKAERIQLWLDRLDRQSQSGQSVAAFCEAEGISIGSFYQWRRRLAPSIGRSRADRSSRSRPRGRRARPGAPGDRDHAFTELLVNDRAGGGAQMVLADRTRIELGRDPDLAVLIVREVLNHAGRNPEGQPCWR